VAGSHGISWPPGKDEQLIIAMKFKKTLIDSLVLFVLIFGISCLIPLVESKSGEKLPLGSIYVNSLAGWRVFIVCHIAVSGILAAVGAIAYRSWMARPDNNPH
jgi:hypothetical protein